MILERIMLSQRKQTQKMPWCMIALLTILEKAKWQGHKQISGCEGLRLTTKCQRWAFWMMKMFCVMTVVVVI